MSEKNTDGEKDRIPFDWDVIMMEPEDEVVGIATVAPDELDKFDSVQVDLKYLKQMVELAEEFDWERVWVHTKYDFPLFIGLDETGPKMVVAPWVDDGDGDDA